MGRRKLGGGGGGACGGDGKAHLKVAGIEGPSGYGANMRTV